MSSSSSSSDSSSDSDDDEITNKEKKDKFRAKVMRRQKRSELENIEEEKKREIRLQQMKHQREYLEMKRKKEAYQRFLLERQRNPNKEPIVSLLATIRNKKIKNNTNIYYINDGIYGSLNGIISDGQEIKIKSDSKQYKSILYGNTCDSFDKIECNLPEYNINDTITINNIGAYSWASASSFNGFTPAKIQIKFDGV